MPLSSYQARLLAALLKRNSLPEEPPRKSWLNEPLSMEGRATLLPMRRTDWPMRGDWEWALPGAAAAAANAFTAPGRAVHGGLLAPEQEAVNFATTFAGGGLLGSRVPKGSLPIQPSGLLGRPAQIERSFAQQISHDPQLSLQHYDNLPGTEGGRILNTDLARELSGAYRADRSLSSSAHEPASALVRAQYQRLLKRAPDANHDPLVLFTGGGTGAGKTTAVSGAVGGLASRAQIIYDTNLASFSSSAAKIDQALQAGKKASIVYVWRDPIEALTNGALARATRQEVRQGSGRTVPLAEHVKTHVNGANTIRELARRYEGNPNVEIRVINNAIGPGNAAEMSLNDLPRLDYASTYRIANDVLETARRNGSISPQVYRGFKGP